MSEESKKQVEQPEEDAPLTEEEAKAVVGGNDSEGMETVPDPDDNTRPLNPLPG